MSSLFNMPWQQAFDASGNTLAGAKLYFYVAGTATPKNVYANIDLSVALPNPVVANGGGRFAPIYLDDSAYKIMLYNANDELIWSADNVYIQAIDADAAAALAAIQNVAVSAGYSQIEAEDPNNFAKAIYKYGNAGNFYTDAGSQDNVYVLQGFNSYSRPNDYYAGFSAEFVCSRPNTSAAAYVNVQNLGLKSIKRWDGTDLSAGDLYGIVKIVYNGTVFLLHENNNLWKVGDIKTSILPDNHNDWFLCNGQALKRVEYPVLFALIGTNFGEGDGATTFNLPDYRGKFLRGLGGDSAADIYTTQAEGLPDITGNFKNGSSNTLGLDGAMYYLGSNSSAFPNGRVDGGADANWTTGDCAFDASRSNAIYGASEHVTPINQAVNFFIKVK